MYIYIYITGLDFGAHVMLGELLIIPFLFSTLSFTYVVDQFHQLSNIENASERTEHEIQVLSSG